MRRPTYEALFQRNVGVFSEEEQDRIRSMRVSVAGVGGLGGTVAYVLARLGVAELRLADPDVFEPSNSNRQFGAYSDTMGENKARAVAKELGRINPDLDLIVMEDALTPARMAAFLDGATCAVDAIDFFRIEDTMTYQRMARDMGLWVHTAQAAAEIDTQYSLDPRGGDSVENYVQRSSAITREEAFLMANFPVLPRAATPEAIQGVLAGGEDAHVTSYAAQPPIAAGLLVDDIVRVHVREQPSLAVFPDVFVFNFENMTGRVVSREVE